MKKLGGSWVIGLLIFVIWMAPLYDMGRLILKFTYGIKIISKGQKNSSRFELVLQNNNAGNKA